MVKTKRTKTDDNGPTMVMASPVDVYEPDE